MVAEDMTKYLFSQDDNTQFALERLPLNNKQKLEIDYQNLDSYISNIKYGQTNFLFINLNLQEVKLQMLQLLFDLQELLLM